VTSAANLQSLSSASVAPEATSVGPFARKLAKELNVIDGKVIVYQIAMLESAPRLIRPMILHGMRGGVPKSEQSRFLPLFHDEAQWKQAAGFAKSAENDAYLLVVSPDGTVRWSGHAQYSDAFYAEFKPHIPQSDGSNRTCSGAVLIRAGSSSSEWRRSSAS
jgi:hypothetical protein